MKKITTIIVCLFALSILALANIVSASNTSYTQTDYNGSTMPTLDGRYTTSDEYSAGAALGFGTNAVFRDFWASSGNVFENLIFETMDTTNNAGDQYVICYDSNNDGGTAPQTDDFKIVITGHGTSATAAWYRGTGSAWTAVTGPAASAFDFKESLATSPTSSTPHYMVEAKIDKQDTAAFGITVLGMNFAMKLNYTDAGTSTSQSWPPAPASNDVPNSWGYVPYSMDPVPESLNVGVVLALSSVAVIAGVIIVRKPKALALKISP
jgi:hypothetical protein